MKKFISGILIGCILASGITIMANSVPNNENYNVPTKFIEMIENAVAKADSREEYNRLNEILKYASNPLTITSGVHYDPNGKYNFGLSKYEKVLTNPDGSILWKRIN
jgi:hypothetical protein